MGSSDAYSGMIYFTYPRDFHAQAKDEFADMETKQIYPRTRELIVDYAKVRKALRNINQD